MNYGRGESSAARTANGVRLTPLRLLLWRTRATVERRDDCLRSLGYYQVRRFGSRVLLPRDPHVALR